jgi:uncharacterized protein with von Willebrand factor type A (vWA) domain
MQTTETKHPFSEQQLIVSKLRWEQAREQYQHALAAMNGEIADAATSGMSQSAIARVLDWPRQRVSKLLADLSK